MGNLWFDSPRSYLVWNCKAKLTSTPRRRVGYREFLKLPSNRLILEYLVGIILQQVTIPEVQASVIRTEIPLEIIEVPPEPTVPKELCNCYLYAKSVIPSLPRMAEITPNTPPSVGSVAILQYKEKHVAIVEKLTSDGFFLRETNYRPCEVSTRFISWDSKRLKGFYSPTGG